jgi:hypothetical protein
MFKVIDSVIVVPDDLGETKNNEGGEKTAKGFIGAHDSIVED